MNHSLLFGEKDYNAGYLTGNRSSAPRLPRAENSVERKGTDRLKSGRSSGEREYA
jgi:hypothetical protein